MSASSSSFDSILAGGAGLLLVLASPASAQDNPPAQVPPAHSLASNAPAQEHTDVQGEGALLDTPLVHIVPGEVSPGPKFENPMASDPMSAQRGMKFFKSFNCVGCHAPNGGGGMGLSLSNAAFKFGSDPANIYLVISHGAPLGMPAWGSILPDSVIWDLVSYIKSISTPPKQQWGTTVSPAAGQPAIEQMPAEFKDTTQPWNYTEKFSKGHKPTQHGPTDPQGMQEPPGGR